VAAASSHSFADPSGLHPLVAQFAPELKRTNAAPPGGYGGGDGGGGGDAGGGGDGGDGGSDGGGDGGGGGAFTQQMHVATLLQGPVLLPPELK
jgi:hypothetical protein